MNLYSPPSDASAAVVTHGRKSSREISGSASINGYRSMNISFFSSSSYDRSPRKATMSIRFPDEMSRASFCPAVKPPSSVVYSRSSIL